MHELYELKDMLCKKLEEYSRKGEITASTLEVIDKLAHAVKNIGKVIEMKEGEEESYSSEGGRSGRSYAYAGRRYGRQGAGNAYARGGRNGRNTNRDNQGRYSSAGSIEDIAMMIGEMMGELPEELKGDAEKFMRKLDSMM